MKAVITVTGKDNKGIVALVSNECTKYGGNILDISQTVLSEYFAMILLTEISELSGGFVEFVDHMKSVGEANGLVIHVMHEDIFNSMHRI